MKTWNPIDNKKSETLSYLSPLTDDSIAKKIDYMMRKGWIPCLEFDGLQIMVAHRMSSSFENVLALEADKGVDRLAENCVEGDGQKMAQKMHYFSLPVMGSHIRKKTRGCALDSTEHSGAHRDGKKGDKSLRFLLYNNKGGSSIVGNIHRGHMVLIATAHKAFKQELRRRFFRSIHDSVNIAG